MKSAGCSLHPRLFPSSPAAPRIPGCPPTSFHTDLFCQVPPSYLIGSIWSLHELFSLYVFSFFLLAPNIHIPREVKMKNEWVCILQSLESLNRLRKVPEKLLFNTHNRRELNHGRQNACAQAVYLGGAAPRCLLLCLFLTARPSMRARSCAGARGQSALPWLRQIVNPGL